MLPLFSLTIFFSAALLFLIQLIYARMVLPLLGGTPAVWNTAMVFYQAVLLAGYGYAHWLSRLRGKRAVWIHAGVLAMAFVVLPFVAPAGGPPAGVQPATWLLGVLSLAIGLPFLSLSATSPLLQSWFSRTGHASARDPYFLSIGSNAGSLAGLLGYPLFVETALALQGQARGWAIGFAVVAAAIVICGGRMHGDVVAAGQGKVHISPRRRLRWVLLALVPSSLMLSVTTYISSDIAAVPLLWVLPLALYLVTFMIVFARRPVIPARLPERLLPALLVAVVLILAMGATTPLLLLAGLHLFAFFIVALVCHGKLAADRPAAGSLTEFYFWMSLGGVLGGAFNALVAPVAFDRIVEYPLMLVAAALLGIAWRDRSWKRLLLAVLPAGIAAALLVPAGPAVAFGAACVGCFFLSRHGLRFGLGMAGVLAVAAFTPSKEGRVLLAERSFFGVHRVEDDGRFRRLFHGKTIHGIQEPGRPDVPLSYYHPDGPLGKIFAAGVNGSIGAVGLGAGALAAYGKPGQQIDFYEIDPAVIRIASDPRYFSYLFRSRARIAMIEGDARLRLAAVPAGRYELLVLDAYGSDSVPVHLLTREAMDLYLGKLAPGGRIAFHVSNLHLDLVPVVAGLAREAGLVCLLAEDDAVTDDEAATGRYPSRWMVVAHSRQDLGALAHDPDWRDAEPRSEVPVWTDDRSSILPLLDFRMR